VSTLLTLLIAGGFTLLKLRRRHRDSRRVHEFVANGFDSESVHQPVPADAVSPPSELAPGADLLDRTRMFMQAECAELVIDDGYGRQTRLRVRAAERADAPSVVELDEAGTAHSDWLLLRSCDQGESTLVHAGTRDHSLRQWLVAHDTRDALLAPVRQSAGSAVLVMRNRTVGSYSRRHLALLENIAEHFAGALATGKLLYQLRYEATHDPLTGLSNRTVLCSRLDDELAAQPHCASDTIPCSLAVLLLDLDRFKEVNDTLGHHVGDALLQVVAQRLRGVLPDSATVARLGGDEFAVVLTGLNQPAREARSYAEAVIASLATPVRLDDALVSCEVSIGIALAGRDASSSELLRHADTAMYTAKTGSEPVVIYSAALDYGRAERLALATDLQSALEGDEFVLLYQPKLSLITGHIIGVEALVRWQHPKLGLLEPDAFIPLAEATGLVEPLTRIVLTKALRQCREWTLEGLSLSVAVNLPARSVTNPALPGAVTDLLRRTGVEPSRLILEITEAGVMDDPERSVPVLERLAATGVTLSLDDFGTGYSSLSYLQRLPVQELKIDRSFVTGLADPAAEPASNLLVRSILNLAAGLALRVVAEGVEDEACLHALRELGVDVAQGYFVGRPMEPAQLIRQLEANGSIPVPQRAPSLAPLHGPVARGVEAAPRSLPEPRERRPTEATPGRGQGRPPSPGSSSL
jgi:diguanylate cyclase (GGDEF)-like protein